MPDVLKTYKLFVGGAFPRSESGRSYNPAACPDVNVARGSRKDLGAAVGAARAAASGWAGRDAYNRGQIVYRLAEMVQARSDAFVAELKACCVTAAAAKKEVAHAIDLITWYAGLPDKLDALLGSQNPVSGPFFNFSQVVPSGVVGVLAPKEPALLGLLAVLLPPLVGGNAVVAVASESHPLPALALAEACATADVPPGAINVLTGHKKELLPQMAAHRDLDGLLLAGRPDEDTGVAAADGVTRVRWARRTRKKWEDAQALRQLSWVEPFVEVKTFWHPVAP